MAPKIKKVREIPSKIKEVKLKIVEPSQSEELEEKIEDSEQEEFQEFMTSRESVAPVLKQSEESQSLEEQTRSSQPTETQSSAERNFSYQSRARSPYSSPQTQNQEEEQYRTAEQTPNITLAPLPRRELLGDNTLPLVEPSQRQRARQAASQEISPELQHAQERNYEESTGTVQRAKRRREMF